MMKMAWIGILGATLATTVLTADVAHSATASDVRSYASGRFAFGIDGQFAGYIRSGQGGGLDVDGTRTIPHEPLTVEVGMGMGRGLFEWIKASWDHGVTPRDLHIKAGDARHRVTTERRLDGALIRKVTVPALDGSSKEPGYFTIEIDPQTIRYAAPKGKIRAEEEPANKKWLPSNFRLEIDGLPCERVSKIDSFTWEQKVVRDEVGKFREPKTGPKISDLTLTVGMADLDAWRRWKSTGGDEKNGSLTFLGPDRTAELMTIGFDHLSIVSIEAPRKGAKAFEVTLRTRGLTLRQ